MIYKTENIEGVCIFMKESSKFSFVNQIKNIFALNKKIIPSGNAQPTIGIALGGGGTWGIAHIGILKILEDNHIPIHYISGTSVGALIGGLYASGVSIEKLKKLAFTTRWKDISRLALPLGGLLSNEPMEKFIGNLIGEKSFSELPIHFTAVATDLISCETVLLNTGKLSTSIRASTAIPGIFQPVILEDRTLVDGGIVNNVPVSVIKNMGADITIAVSLSPSLNNWTPRNSLQMILKSYLIMQQNACRKETSQADVVIPIDTTNFSPIDLHQSKNLFERGLISGSYYINKIQLLIKSYKQNK